MAAGSRGAAHQPVVGSPVMRALSATSRNPLRLKATRAGTGSEGTKAQSLKAARPQGVLQGQEETVRHEAKRVQEVALPETIRPQEENERREDHVTRLDAPVVPYCRRSTETAATVLLISPGGKGPPRACFLLSGPLYCC